MKAAISCLFLSKKKLPSDASVSLPVEGRRDEQQSSKRGQRVGIGTQNQPKQAQKGGLRGSRHLHGSQTLVDTHPCRYPTQICSSPVASNTVETSRAHLDEHSLNLCLELRGQINSALVQFEQGISQAHRLDGTTAPSIRIAAASRGSFIAQEDDSCNSRAWPASAELVTFTPAASSGNTGDRGARGKRTSVTAEASSTGLQPQQNESLPQLEPSDLLQSSSVPAALPSPPELHLAQDSRQHSTPRGPSQQACVASGELSPRHVASARESSQHCIHRSPLQECGLQINTFHAVDATSANRMVQQLYDDMEDSIQLQVRDSS